MHAPWRESGDPYEVLVAAVMAQQTQMSRVMPSYERFVAAFPTVESLARATAGDVIRVWAGMGYNQRAIRLHRAARTIVEGGWPRDAASLEKIDGIGPFTAAIIASFAFGEPAACVDTNVRRVLGRLAGDESIDGRRLQALADASLAAHEPARWNQALMDYGARVCTIRPKCAECALATSCPSRRDVHATTQRATRNGNAGAARVARIAVGARRAVPTPRTAGEPAARRTPPRILVGAQPAAPALRVAGERGTYTAKPRTAKTQPKFEGSTRWWRGRIVDALRALPAGESKPLAELRRAIVDGNGALSLPELRVFVRALEADGLVVFGRGRVALPE